MNAPLRGAEPDRQRYRGFIISYWAKPIPTRNCDWDFAHEDFDGPGDNRYGVGPTAADCRRQIDDMLADEDGDPNEPDEGPAVIYSAEEEMAFIAEAERREMYALEEPVDDAGSWEDYGDDE